MIPLHLKYKEDHIHFEIGGKIVSIDRKEGIIYIDDPQQEARLRREAAKQKNKELEERKTNE